MFPVTRRAIAQPSRSILRQLSTVTEQANAQDQSLATVLLQQRVAGSDALDGPVKALPVEEPVYLALTSLLPGTKNIRKKVAVLNPTVFKHPSRRDILHLCVVQYRDGLRQGSGSTKTRAEVAGSGRKIRPQKGSGKARLGERGNPMLRGGGVAFGPKPRDFSTKLPRKVIDMGMRVALSMKLREHRLGVAPSLAWNGWKTKHLAQRIEHLGWRKTLFVTGEEVVPPGLERAGQNIVGVESKTVRELTVYDVVRWPRIILDTHAVDWLEWKLAKDLHPAQRIEPPLVRSPPPKPLPGTVGPRRRGAKPERSPVNQQPSTLQSSSQKKSPRPEATPKTAKALGAPRIRKARKQGRQGRSRILALAAPS
ncbi:hypothetical protein PLICRDRAFT_153100 [Plicaturopsis crispa FD-325 SS-3]|nr:hypothetical protein PLICRDRAFT_153100 [Plicaturopsis crispa FD-325 SS-3]